MYDIKSTRKLDNGVEIPLFGLGVWRLEDGRDTYDVVRSALDLGYRLIDTAAYYGNEDSVGRAVRESGLSREDVFVCTKVWMADQGYEPTLQAYEAGLKRLGLDYVDMYLIHWPVAGKVRDTWRALEKLYEDGKVRAIGVCNFNVELLRDLSAWAKIRPMLNQMEVHPFFTRQDMQDYCMAEKLALQAYSPLARAGKLFETPLIAGLAEKHGKSPAQIVLRWHLQKGILTIPKSARKERLKENSEFFDFSLSQDELALIDGLNRNESSSKTKFPMDEKGQVLFEG